MSGMLSSHASPELSFVPASRVQDGGSLCFISLQGQTFHFRIPSGCHHMSAQPFQPSDFSRIMPLLQALTWLQLNLTSKLFLLLPSLPNYLCHLICRVQLVFLLENTCSIASCYYLLHLPLCRPDSGRPRLRLGPLHTLSCLDLYSSFSFTDQCHL